MAGVISFLGEHEEDIREPAANKIAARPTLIADLTEPLRSDHPAAALKYLWLRMPTPPRELAQPTGDAMVGMVKWSRARLADPDTAGDPDIDSVCEASVVLADAFRDSGLDFRTPLRDLLAFLTEKPVNHLPRPVFSRRLAERAR